VIRILGSKPLLKNFYLFKGGKATRGGEYARTTTANSAEPPTAESVRVASTPSTSSSAQSGKGRTSIEMMGWGGGAGYVRLV